VRFSLTVKLTVSIFDQDLKKLYRHVKKQTDGKKYYKNNNKNNYIKKL